MNNLSTIPFASPIVFSPDAYIEELRSRIYVVKTNLIKFHSLYKNTLSNYVSQSKLANVNSFFDYLELVAVQFNTKLTILAMEDSKEDFDRMHPGIVSNKKKEDLV